MADGGHPNRLLGIGELVENPVGANAQRVEPAQFAAERMSSLRFALEQTQCILDRIDQRPVERKQLATGPAGEDESGQRSAGCGSTFRQLATKLGEGDRFIASDLGETGLQGDQGIGIG